MAAKRKQQSRSKEAKVRILEAARRRFSADGYERATIRAIASEADIDPSMVIRYFSSKEGLFAAAASFDLSLPNLSAIPRKKRGRCLVQHYLDLWEHDAARGGLAILLRTAATNDGAAEKVRQVFREQVLPIIAAVSPDAPAKRAALIASQLLGMAYCRYVVEMPALVALDERVIISKLGETIQRYLDAPIDDA